MFPEGRYHHPEDGGSKFLRRVHNHLRLHNVVNLTAVKTTDIFHIDKHFRNAYLKKEHSSLCFLELPKQCSRHLRNFVSVLYTYFVISNSLSGQLKRLRPKYVWVFTHDSSHYCPKCKPKLEIVNTIF